MKRFFLFIAITLFLVSCKDDEVTFINVEQIVETESGVTITWTKPDVVGFKFYQIMRSSDGVSYSVINSISDTKSEAYNQFYTNFTDISYPFVDSLYYKIIAVGDESVSSENILIKIKKPLVLYNPINYMAAVPGTDKVAFTYYNSGYKLAIADMSTSKIIKEISIDNIDSYDYLSCGSYKGQPEIYRYSYDNYEVRAYDANTLDLKYVSPYCYLSNPKIQVDKNGNIYMFSKSSSRINSVSRDGIVKTFNTLSTTYDISYDSISNTLKALGVSAISNLNLAVDGTITTGGSITIPSYLYYSIVDNTNYIYRKETSYTPVYDCNTATAKQLNNSISFATILFKNGYFYCLPTNGAKLIYCYSANTFDLVKMIEFREQIRLMSINNNYLYVSGSYNGSYIVERKELIK